MTSAYHKVRLGHQGKRSVVWAALWRYYFRHRIDATDTVLDLGCGYGDFINHVIAKRRIALDLWPEFVAHIGPGIETLVTSLTDPVRSVAKTTVSRTSPASSQSMTFARTRWSNSMFRRDFSFELILLLR